MVVPYFLSAPHHVDTRQPGTVCRSFGRIQPTRRMLRVVRVSSKRHRMHVNVLIAPRAAWAGLLLIVTGRPVAESLPSQRLGVRLEMSTERVLFR